MVRARTNGHGGKRTATPGKAYSQRTDLMPSAQPVRVQSGQEYGQRQAQEQAQRAVPLPGPTPTPPVPLSAPSMKPTEPVTAGLPIGPGPGPEVLTRMAPSEQAPILEMLQALYAEFPNNDLRSLIEEAEYRQAP